MQTKKNMTPQMKKLTNLTIEKTSTLENHPAGSLTVKKKISKKVILESIN